MRPQTKRVLRVALNRARKHRWFHHKGLWAFHKVHHSHHNPSALGGYVRQRTHPVPSLPKNGPLWPVVFRVRAWGCGGGAKHAQQIRACTCAGDPPLTSVDKRVAGLVRCIHSFNARYAISPMYGFATFLPIYLFVFPELGLCGGKAATRDPRMVACFPWFR